MAKITPKLIKNVKQTAIKTVNVRVRVSRLEQRTGKEAFVACANLRTGGHIRGKYPFPKLRDACAYAENPRRAIAGAMRKAATKLAIRSGAFAGLSGRTRRRRRRR